MHNSIYDPDPAQVALAEKLSQHLTDYEPNIKKCVGVWCVLKHRSADGRGLSIYQRGGKYEAHVFWPGTEKPADHPHSIKVSVHRGAESLAQDIGRRLLPGYDEAYAKQQQILQEQQEYADREIALRDEIVAIVEGTVARHQADQHSVSVYNYGLRQVRVSGDHVELKTGYLPRDVAVEVAKFLRSRMPRD